MATTNEAKVVEIKTEDMDIEAPDAADARTTDTYTESVSGQVNGIKQENELKEFTGKVIQVTNVSPQGSVQQMATLFGFLGTVTDIRMYPSDDSVQVAVKLCYLKYDSSDCCGIAQHLTNTVFIDRALIVVPLDQEEIPEEPECAQLLASINAFAGMASGGFLATPGGNATATACTFPTPPVITTTVDPVIIEEIRRTIYVTQIDEAISSGQILAFFSGVGEIKYLRFCKAGEEGKYAFLEFTQIESVPAAMQYNGVLFGGRPLKVDYAKSSIKKPESEVIASGRGGQRGLRTGKSRSRSRDRRRSPRRRSRERKRSRSKSASKRKKSRSRSRGRKKSKSRSPPRRKKSRSKSKEKKKEDERKKKKSKSKSPERKKKKSVSKSPERKKSKSPERKKSKSPERRKSRKSKSKSPEKKRKSKSRSPRRRKKEEERKKSRSKSKSPEKKKKSSSSRKDREEPKRSEKDKDKDKKYRDSEKSEKKSEKKDKPSSSSRDKEREREKEREKEKVRNRDSDGDSPERDSPMIDD